MAGVLCLLLLLLASSSSPQQIRYKSSKFEIRPDEAQQLEADLSPLVAPGVCVRLRARG
jgi:hypothetical protein